jgi:hypothetical protein
MTKRSLLFMVLGIAIGASMGFVPQPPPNPSGPPNHITFTILSTGKLYLAPNKRDIIHWKRDSGTGPVNITFTHGSPCDEPNGSSTCTVNTDQGYFLYDCTDNNGTSICVDPGIEPGSGGDGTTGPRRNIATNSVQGININSLVAALQIGCDSSGNVAVLDSFRNRAPAINAGSTIQWTSPSMQFKVSEIGPAKSCVGGTHEGPVQWCGTTATERGKQPSTVKYHVQVSGPNACQKSKEGTFSFTLK